VKRGNANGRRLEVVLLFFLLAFSFFLYANPINTGFVTLQHTDPELEISLSRDYYKSNETIDGNITINFKGPINMHTNLTVEFRDYNYTKSIADVLFSLGKTYSNTEDEIKAVNPSDSKVLTYDQAGKKLLGFRLPFSVSVNSINMNISSTVVDNSYPSSLSIDVNDDNDIEWGYLGEFTGFKSEYITSETLDINVAPASTILDNSKIYHCSLLDIQPSRDFEISANYRLFNETSLGGDIRAALFSYDSFSNQLLDEKGNCDLSEPQVFFGWNSCTIKLSESIEGDFLVCLYNKNTVGSYRLASDFSESESTFQCGLDTTDCEQKGFFDYFIRLRAADYNVVFNTPLKLSEMNVSMTKLINSIEDKANVCDVADGDFCVIPFSISSESKGKLIFSDLVMNIGGIEYNLIYDLTNIPGVIYEINRQPIENTSLNLPIKTFNLTMGDESDIIVVSLEPGEEIDETVNLFEFDSGDIQTSISTLERSLNNLKNNELLSYFDYNLDQSLIQLNGYKSELNLLSNVSVNIIENETQKLEDKINSFKNKLPVSIEETKTVKDVSILNPNDLQGIVKEENRNSIFNLQEKISVNLEAKTIKSILYSGEEVKKTLVKKSVKINENLGDVYVYERIPKNMANTADNLKLIDDFEIVENDPLIRKRINGASKGKTIDLSYVIDGDFTHLSSNLKTIIVPVDSGSFNLERSIETHVCGDNLCTAPFEDNILCPEDCGGKKFSWTPLVIGIIVLLIGILYFNFYKGKFDFRTLTRGKNPFNNNEDLDNVKKFIKNSSSKNIENKNITKTLLHKGWTKNQIKYAFEEIEWDQKRALIKIEVPNKNEGLRILKKYIKRCRKSRMDDKKIREILSRKGWSEEEINEGFKKSNSWF